MTERERAGFSRREVNLGLLAAAFARVAGRAPVIGTRLRLFDFAIAGGGFHGLAEALPRIGPGTVLQLRREPDNPHDADAVAVLLDGTRLGYLPREANPPIARLLDRGERLTAEVLRMNDFRRPGDLPDELVCTDTAWGDPVIGLVLEPPAAPEPRSGRQPSTMPRKAATTCS